MLKSRIVVDLPSVETERARNPVDWVRSLLGREVNLHTGNEELTVSAFSLVEGLVEAFGRAGVKDVISLMIDKKVVYMDTSEVSDDLHLLQAAAEGKGILDRKFKEMHLVLSHRSRQEDGLHTLIDVRIQSRVMRDQAEMQVELSSRVTSLQIRPGETAKDYSERIRAFTGDAGAVERYRLELEALTGRLADALRASLVGARVTAFPAIVQVVRPDAGQIARFRKLPFGDRVERPSYRAVPTHARAGSYVDPHYYYYYDPYYALMNWVMLDTMLHATAWHSPHLAVVDPAGQTLATGADLSHAGDGWGGADAVSFADSGDLEVSPEVASSDGAGDTFWGDGDGGQGDAGWGDAGADGDSSGGGDVGGGGGGSSCGSSCSGGSSCGGGCGGGGGD